MALFVGIGEVLILSAFTPGFAAAYAVFASFRQKIRLKPPAPEAVVWALALGYFLTFSALTLARHYGMATYGLDLGYYGNAIYQFGRGRFFQQSLLPNEVFVNHCAPLLAAFFFFRRKNLAAGLVCTGRLALAQDELAVHAARELARTPVR